MSGFERDPGSFRDPGGTVFVGDDVVYRTVMPDAAPDYESARDSGLIEALVAQRFLLGCEALGEERPADFPVGAVGAAGAVHVLRQPRLPFVSYPYEWCFRALRDAALLHLDLHLRCLEQGFTLTDATAYNVQFWGARPIFIDLLSIRPYREGEIWAGHRQFCEQFLNPLLLDALCGVAPNDWYRGSLEGIAVTRLAKLLRFRHKMSWNVLKHVVAQAAFQPASSSAAQVTALGGAHASQIKLPLPAFQSMLKGLRRWIAGLEPRTVQRTTWASYANDNSYAGAEADTKARFVREFCAAVKPAVMWDMGCNTGDYAVHALSSGAGLVVGFDADPGAVDRAYARARAQDLQFLPLQIPLTNPSPSQGWAQRERRGLGERASANAVLALALVHHLAIAGNVPLGYVVAWLVELAPNGVVEFVPKTDPMVIELLRLREDVFADYSQEHFEAELRVRAEIVRAQTVSSSGRTLYWFARRAS